MAREVATVSKRVCPVEQRFRGGSNLQQTDVVAVHGPALANSATLQPILRDSTEVQQVRADDELVTKESSLDRIEKHFQIPISCWK